MLVNKTACHIYLFSDYCKMLWALWFHSAGICCLDLLLKRVQEHFSGLKKIYPIKCIVFGKACHHCPTTWMKGFCSVLGFVSFFVPQGMSTSVVNLRAKLSNLEEFIFNTYKVILFISYLNWI